MPIIKALRVGGTGWVTNNWDSWPWKKWAIARDGLYKGSLNLVLELRYYFDVPNDGLDEKIGKCDDATYFLTPVRVRCLEETVENKDWLDAFIVRKREEPAKLLHMVEVVAPEIKGLSKSKEWFDLDGPFREIVA
jgi:hypothetical protein